MTPDPPASGGLVVWIEGVPGSGKSTLGRAVCAGLRSAGWSTENLDGGRVLSVALRSIPAPPRNPQGGRTLSVTWVLVDLLHSAFRQLLPGRMTLRRVRELQARRVIHVARALAASGRAVVVAMPTPYESSREAARAEVRAPFLEVWTVCPIEIRRTRDIKGNLTVGSRKAVQTTAELEQAFEPPLRPDVVVDTSTVSVGAGANRVLDKLTALGYRAPDPPAPTRPGFVVPSVGGRLHAP